MTNEKYKMEMENVYRGIVYMSRAVPETMKKMLDVT